LTKTLFSYSWANHQATFRICFKKKKRSTIFAPPPTQTWEQKQNLKQEVFNLVQKV